MKKCFMAVFKGYGRGKDSTSSKVVDKMNEWLENHASEIEADPIIKFDIVGTDNGRYHAVATVTYKSEKILSYDKGEIFDPDIN